MKAIRVRKRAKAGGFTYHWLLDPERTLCGRKPAELDVDATLDLEQLPGIEACLGCERAREDWASFRISRGEGERRVTAPPSTGVMRTTGSLTHGMRPRHGRRI